MSDLVIDYDSTPSPVLDSFHQDDSFIRAIMGPVGSGKSVACSMETMLRANEQLPLKNSKIRPTKFAVVRNTYRELEDTTIATVQQWIPPELGNWKSSTHTFTAEWDHPSDDGTIVEMEIIFRALDTPKDARKLLSLEVTGAWFNEAREIPWGIIDLMQTRCGRFPPAKLGGATWDGIWIDTNPPDEDSQFYHVFEEMKPEGYRLFRQPGGCEPDAENVQNLKAGYYDRLRRGKTEDWVGVYVNGDYGFVMDGKPIYPEYHDRLHCSDTVVPYIENEAIYLGMDFGLTPACVFVQKHAGTYYVIDEIVTENMGAVSFIKEVARRLRSDYKSSQVFGWGDPAGDQRSPIRENESVFKIINQAGVPVIPSPDASNDPVTRRESVGKLLSSIGFAGVPRLIVSPKCRFLRKGLRGAFCYKRLQVAGTERYRDTPDKNIYSHVCEALEYLMVGLGEGYVLIESSAGASQRVPKVQGALS